LALEQSTGRRVRECIFVFTRTGTVIERSISGIELDDARDAVRGWLAGASRDDHKSKATGAMCTGRSVLAGALVSGSI
jgi:hypothetical protein